MVYVNFLEVIMSVKIEKKLKALKKLYDDELTKLADAIFDEKIAPYCKERQLSFTLMNGIPRLVNLDNEYVKVPNFIVDLFEICDENGHCLMYASTKEYKFSEDVDFDKADTKNHEEQMKSRSLASLVFSPALGKMKF